jgi:hypothetical protein
MYRRDDEKLHCRDGEQAEHFSASQGAEQAGFSAQDGSEDVEDSCRRAGDVPGFWSRAEDVGYFWSGASAPGRTCCSRRDEGANGSRHDHTPHALQLPVQPPRCPLQPTTDPALADLIANFVRESSSAHSWSEEEEHNDIGALAAHRLGEMVLCDDIRHSNVSSEDEGVRGVASVAVARQRVECSEGAAVGSVGSVDVPSQRAECGEGAVVGSVGSVAVVDAPSQRAECGLGAVVGMYVGGVALVRNFPFVGEVRLAVLTRLRERAIRSFRTIDTSATRTRTTVQTQRTQKPMLRAEVYARALCASQTRKEDSV